MAFFVWIEKCTFVSKTEGSGSRYKGSGRNMDISIQGVNMIIAFAGFLLCFYGILQICVVGRFEPETGRVAIQVFVCLFMLCLSIAMAMLFRGKPGDRVHIIMVIAHYGEFVFTTMLIDAIARVIRDYISKTEQSERIFRLIRVCMILQIVLITVNLFTGDIYTVGSNNIGFREDLYLLAYVLPTLMIALCFVFRVMRMHELTKRQIVVFDLCFALLILAELVQVKVHGFNLTLLTAIVCTTLFYILLLEEQRRRYEEQIRRTTLMNARIVSGQIEPHFLGNTLVMIRELCEPGSEAFYAITSLAEFMHGSLRALSGTELIPIEDELETIDYYLDIQNRRFGDSIKVIWDIEDVEFKVPPFSVQIAVENAIKHGIRKKPSGQGTITLGTYETDSDHIVRVHDDGAGFDISNVKYSVGINSLKERVSTMCRGRVEISSRPGEGTEVLIFIPRENSSEDPDHRR